MNWDAISAISETIASVAVVVSLVYLAMQVKHSNKLSQSQTRTDLRHMAQSEVFKMIDYPEICQAFFKEELTEQEAIQLHNFLISALRFREFIWRQYQLNLLDEETFRNYMKAVLQVLGSDRNRRWWDTYKNTTFDPGFIAYIDDLSASQPKTDLRGFWDSIRKKG